MKRNSLIVAILPVILGLIVLQSCTSTDNATFTVYNSFTEAAVTAPLSGSTIKITGTTVDLKWASTDADGDSPIADVYFGLDSKPGLYKAGHTSTTLTVPVELGKSYYWHVTMIDKNKVVTYGPTWSFTVFEPIGIFVGTFNCDEPAEGWSYNVVFSKLSANTLKIADYWASWPGVFTLNFTNNTYSMPLTDFGGGYSAIESGTINPANGGMKGHYIIYSKGKNIEEGDHTYTKK